MKIFNRLIIAALSVLMSHAALADITRLSELSKRVLNGERLSQETIDQCHEDFLAYYESLREKTRSNDLLDMPDQECASHYVNAIKMAVIDPERHGGWPYRHASLHRTYKPLKEQLANGSQLDLLVAIIIPALVNKDLELAVVSFEALKKEDKVWANYILGLVKMRKTRTFKEFAELYPDQTNVPEANKPQP